MDQSLSKEAAKEDAEAATEGEIKIKEEIKIEQPNEEDSKNPLDKECIIDVDDIPGDTLGLLQETSLGYRERDDDDNDQENCVDADDDDAASPGSNKDTAGLEDCENEQLDEAEQDNLGDDIEINEEFHLKYEDDLDNLRNENSPDNEGVNADAEEDCAMFENRIINIVSLKEDAQNESKMDVDEEINTNLDESENSEKLETTKEISLCNSLPSTSKTTSPLLEGFEEPHLKNTKVDSIKDNIEALDREIQKSSVSIEDGIATDKNKPDSLCFDASTSTDIPKVDEKMDVDDVPPKEKSDSGNCSKSIDVIDLSDEEEPMICNKNETEKTPEDDKKQVSSNVLNLESSDEEMKSNENKDTVSVTIPSSIEIMSSSKDHSTKISSFSSTSVISGLPPTSAKHLPTMRINTSEITISPVSRSNEESAAIKPVEIVNIDSDEEEDKKISNEKNKKTQAADSTDMCEINKITLSTDQVPSSSYCVISTCTGVSKEFLPCPLYVLKINKINKRKRDKHPEICKNCLDKSEKIMKADIGLFFNTKPLINLKLEDTEEHIETLDFDSDEEDDNKENVPYSNGPVLPMEEIEFLNENLPVVMKDVMEKYKYNEQIDLCTKSLKNEFDLVQKNLTLLEQEMNEVLDAMNRNRNGLYDTIKFKHEYLPPLIIPSPYDEKTEQETRRSARIKKPSEVALTNLEPNQSQPNTSITNRHIPCKVESNIPLQQLPPIGCYTLPKVTLGDLVYTVKNSLCGAWIAGMVTAIDPAGLKTLNGMPLMFSLFSVKFFVGNREKNKKATGRQVAFSQPAQVRYPIGTRVIAKFKDTNVVVKKSAYYYSGVIAESPMQLNRFRYLVFFDDGYSQYVYHQEILPIVERSKNIWDDVYVSSRDFIKKYLTNYPERPMVRMSPGQVVRTEKNGQWWDAKVVEVDSSLALLRFHGATTRDEWIYRGSTRLLLLFQQKQAADRRAQALGRHRPGMLAVRSTARTNIPYVEYTRQQDQDSSNTENSAATLTVAKPQRSVARKSTAIPIKDLTPECVETNAVQVRSQVKYFTPKIWIHPEKYVAHACSEKCNKNVMPLEKLRTYNPLVRPLLSSWERHIVICRHRNMKMFKVIKYKAPCGRLITNMKNLHQYLRLTKSKFSVDLFSFDLKVHCFSEYVLKSCIASKPDISHNKEAVPVPCINSYDESLPEFWEYSTSREPTKGVTLNTDDEFLCGCDCTDDCQDKEKCKCWQLTYEGARFIGLDTSSVGYQYKRLLAPVPTGIFECNSKCKCADTCFNRVAQHPLQLKIQVFKTTSKGWGIRTLNDIPKGTFICIYAGYLLTDAVANSSEGLSDGDKYLADLDYIEVVEQLKENYESDVPDDLSNSSFESQTDDEDKPSGKERRHQSAGSDEEFRPAILPSLLNQNTTTVIKRQLRPRENKNNKRKKKCDDAKKSKPKKDSDINKDKLVNIKKENDDSNKPKRTSFEKDQLDIDYSEVLPDVGCPENVLKNSDISRNLELITISDDEEVFREPSRFTAPEGFNDDDCARKHKSVRSYFGEDEAFIMDARVRGNIGRYLNHSCSPNVFVQNVFVDTHDPRFPWVSFFALESIVAGTELTWNYNYEIGSVPGKVIYCKCEAPNCRGRLL